MTLLDQIEAFQIKTGYSISNSLKTTLEETNGLEGEFVSQIESFENWKPLKSHEWFIDKTFTQEEENKVSNLFVIGDIMINSHQWGIELNTKGEKEHILELDTFEIVANSLEDFISKNKKDPYSLVK